MLTDFTTWLFTLVTQVFTAAWQFLQDTFIAAFGLVVNAFASLLAAIPVPAFISGGMATMFSGMDSGVLFMVSACGVPAALAIVGAGYAFRLTRKFLTLFQW